MYITLQWLVENFFWALLIGSVVSVVVGRTIGLLSDRYWNIYHAKRKSKENTGSPDSWRMFIDS